jgi:cobalamin biosynthesis protein CobT
MSSSDRTNKKSDTSSASELSNTEVKRSDAELSRTDDLEDESSESATEKKRPGKSKKDLIGIANDGKRVYTG